MLMQTILWGCAKGEDPAPTPTVKETYLTGKTKTGQKSADFKGYKVINKTFQTRLFAEDSEFDIGTYLNPEVDAGNIFASFFSTKLTDLLGANEGNGESQRFKNGKPNTMNMLLWYMAFDQLGKDISRHCSENQLALNPIFSETLTAVCSPSEDYATRKSQIRKFWKSIVNFDAPEEEFESFHKLFAQKITDGESIDIVISEMVVASLYHPKFLLKN